MTREQEPITKNDIALIHTEGLDEEIRCAMCTNPIANDRGCNGSCTVNDKMYKKVMNTIENHIISGPTTTVSLEVYKQVAWERDIAIEQLHELGYEFGEKINYDTCVYSKETDGSDCCQCTNGIKNSYKPATEDNVTVDKFDKAINQSDLEEWIMETFPDWCDGDVRLILNHMDEMRPIVCPYCEKLIGV